MVFHKEWFHKPCSDHNVSKYVAAHSKTLGLSVKSLDRAAGRPTPCESVLLDLSLLRYDHATRSSASSVVARGLRVYQQDLRIASK